MDFASLLFIWKTKKASRESRNWGNLAGCSLLKNKDINWAQTRSQHIREGTIDTKTVYPEWLLTPLRLKSSKTTLCFETNCLRKDQAYSQSPQLMLCENGHWTHFLSRVFCKSLNHVFQLPKTKKKKRKKRNVKGQEKAAAGCSIHTSVTVLLDYTLNDVL